MFWWSAVLEAAGSGSTERKVEISIKAREQDEVIARAKQEAANRCPGTKPEDWILKSIRIER